MPQLILYCQYLSVMGHLKRSSGLAHALYKRFKATVILVGAKSLECEAREIISLPRMVDLERMVMG